MKSFILILFPIIISISITAQTLDEIVSKHLDAIGHDNLLKKHTITAKGKIIQGVNEIPITTYNKRPDKFRMDSNILGHTFTQAYDGKTGWVLNPMMGIDEPKVLHPGEIENLKFQSYFDGLLYNDKEKNYTLEYIGKEDVSDLNTYVILLIKASGDSMHIYIDTENYQILKTRSKAGVGGEFKYIENIYSDYREVDGILSAFNVKTQVEEMILSELVYESYDYTADIPDSIFTFSVNETTDAQKPDTMETD
jgi:outer membrane lipoprotein-sorting protein